MKTNDFNPGLFLRSNDVRPPQTPEEAPACQARLDRLDGDLQHRLHCMSENGGMSLCDKTKRQRGS